MSIIIFDSGITKYNNTQPSSLSALVHYLGIFSKDRLSSKTDCRRGHLSYSFFQDIKVMSNFRYMHNQINQLIYIQWGKLIINEVLTYESQILFIVALYADGCRYQRGDVAGVRIGGLGNLKGRKE